MRVLHVGLGDFGVGWFRVLQNRKDTELIGVVDKNPQTFDQVSGFSVPCYTSLETALSDKKPDFILNATPPWVHMAVNREAFSRNIPVLMEKPVSEDPAEILECLQYSKNGQKLMVAENYRYLLQNRFVKEQLDSRLHNIAGVNTVFRKHHNVDNYHKDCRHPMLFDVGVHNLDLLRFFTNKEALRVYSRIYTPSWSWYKGFSNVKLLAEMEDGVHFCFDASLDARASTSWEGTWTFTAENGVCIFDGKKLYWDIEGKQIETDVPVGKEYCDKHIMLDEFIAFLRGGAKPATDITDQYKTYAIAIAAMRSFEEGCAVQITGDTK